MADRTKLSIKRFDSKNQRRIMPKQQTISFRPSTSPINQALYLQRTIGNSAFQRLFTSGISQRKLRIGQPNDMYEQEADRVAEQVMRIPELVVQRKPG